MLRANQLHHAKPSWLRSDAVYFITVCANPPNQNHFCHPDLGLKILDAIHFYHTKDHWYCQLALLMPDHIHLLASFPADSFFSQVVGRWKRGLSRNHRILWQRDFFEHRLRNEAEFKEKADYILHNPVRAGLVKESQEWNYSWMPDQPTAARDSGGYPNP